MHRREPDAWNSNYWWRQVGSHPVFDELRAKSPELGYDYTTPQDFVAFCEKVRGAGTPDERLAERVQQLEWEAMMGWCVRSK